MRWVHEIKNFDEWGIPLLVLSGWVIFLFVVVLPFMNHLKKRAEQSRHQVNAVLLSALGTPLLLLFLGIGISFFTDLLPSLPQKWEKYSNGLLLILFVLAAYLFLDRLMLRVLRHYSRTIDVIASTAGVIKTLYRSTILIFAAFIILDRLKITITPFIASLGIGGLVVALALQDTLSNFFSGIYLFFDKPIRIGDYVKLESGEEGYISQVGWHSTRIQMLSNNVVIISNAKLATSRITNFYLPERELAVLVNLSVVAQSDLGKVEKVTVEVAREVLRETAGGVKEFEPFIRYNKLGESGVHFTVILRGSEYADQYLLVHEFIKRLHRRYETEGIRITPSVETLIRNLAFEADKDTQGVPQE